VARNRKTKQDGQRGRRDREQDEGGESDPAGGKACFKVPIGKGEEKKRGVQR